MGYGRKRAYRKHIGTYSGFFSVSLNFEEHMCPFHTTVLYWGYVIFRVGGSRFEGGEINLKQDPGRPWYSPCGNVSNPRSDLLCFAVLRRLRHAVVPRDAHGQGPLHQLSRFKVFRLHASRS